MVSPKTNPWRSSSGTAWSVERSHCPSERRALRGGFFRELLDSHLSSASQIAVNYPARAYGITRHETPAEALKKCPDLKLVHVQTYKNGEKEPGYWDGAKPETHKVSRRLKADA